MKTVTVRIGARGRPGETPSLAWNDITGKPSVFPPSSHTHSISNVTGLQSALDGKAASFHTHGQSDVTGLTSAMAAKADLVDGMVPTNQIPAIAITEFLGSVSSQSAMLALTGQRGDWCNRSDVSKAFVLVAEPASTLSNWAAIDYPAAPVLSVNGQAGTVVLSKGDLGLGSVNNTSDNDKPISTATQAALNEKAATSHTHEQSDVMGLVEALASKCPLALPINTQTGNAYTLTLADGGTLVTLSNASPVTLRVPPNSEVAHPVGTPVIVQQAGTGQVTISPGSGVTLEARGNRMRVTGQYGVARLVKKSTNTWILDGDVTTLQSPLLDGLTTGLISATSISRQIVTGYTGPLIRVINSTTSAQTDIGFSATTNRLDETALLAARTGSEVLYIHTIYDQSGNGRHRVLASETATANRLRIVDSTGTIERLEGFVCGTAVVNLSGPYTEASAFTSPAGTTISAYAVHQIASASNDNRVLSVAVGTANDYSDPAAGVLIQRSGSTPNVTVYRGNAAGTSVSQPYAERAVTTVRFTGSGGVLENIYGTATHESTASFGYTRTLVGGQSSTIGVFRIGDKFAECAFWSSDIGATTIRAVRQTAYNTFTANPSSWTGKKIIWAGTSIPATNPGAGTYPAQLASALGTFIVNEGSGSSRITWDASTLGTYPTVEGKSLSATLAELSANSLTAFNAESWETKLKDKAPDWIVLDHSVNDVYAPVGTDADTKAKFVGALQYIYDQMKANRPGVKFLLLSPYSRQVAGGAFVSQINAIVAAMASWASGKSDVVYIDVLNGLNLSLGDMATYATDGTHPSTAGVALIKNFLQVQMLTMTP